MSLKYNINTNNIYLPWTEKYRPNKLDNIVSQTNIINCLKKIIENQSLPHLLFYGSSGTGKTSTILAISKLLYGPNKNLMVLELNASDDRGINLVREEIKEFAESISIFSKSIKLIILDEADAMTYEAQFALRRVIEKYSITTRFCLICNYLNKIIDPIRSRCMKFRFSPIQNKEKSKIIKYIGEKENIELNNNIIKSIIDISEGDLRKSINILQTLSLYDKKNLNDNICYDFYGIPSYNLMDEYFKILIDNNMDFKKKIDIFEEIMQKKQYNLKHFVNRIHKYIIKNIKTIDNNSDISNEPIKNILLDQDYLINLLDKLSIFEEQLNNTTFDDINYGSFLSLFNYKIV